MPAAGDPLAVDPEQALRDALRTYEWAGRQLRLIAAGADDSSAAVGAVRAAVAVADRLSVLTMAGILLPPETAFVMRARAAVDAEKRRFVCAVLDALERRGIDYGDLDGDLEVEVERTVAA